MIVPTSGAEGVTGCVLIVTLAEGGDTQPNSLVTVKVYEPAGIAVIVVDVPDPGVLVPPGVLVTVHVPDDGNPVRVTLPVETAHVGWVVVPISGADGVGGCGLIVTFAEDGDTQPAADVTVKV